MTKLTDTQAVLLSTAAKRDGLNLFPLPKTIDASGVTKTVDALLKRKLAEECETGDTAATHRVDGNIGYGVFATPAGLAAIGIAPMAETTTDEAQPPVEPPARPRKTDAVLILLRREEGATLAELVEATGWLPHTTRAALTGLRKKSHVVERTRRGAETCYRIAS